MRAELEGTVLAEGQDTVARGGFRYFAPQDVAFRYLRPVSLRPSLRGTSARFDVCIGGTRAVDAAWCIARPRWWSQPVRGRVAFAPPVVVRRVDDAPGPSIRPTRSPQSRRST
ncbi:DUF427 domain-containing protein [Nocardioides sp. AX2bis]|uniref:DUF427 domain-containing protein n=1 Tax=Nocardioides sp. AX2bis TaxID=2653157 RepID=UPI003FA5F3DF